MCDTCDLSALDSETDQRVSFDDGGIPIKCN